MIMRSKTSWIFDVCGTGFPETRRSDLPTSRIASRPDCQRDGKRSAGFIPTAPSGSSIHYSLSTAFHYSLKRNSLSLPPHTQLFVTPQYLMMSTHGGSWAAGVKNMLFHTHRALWIIKLYCKASRLFLLQHFGIPALRGQCENSGYGSKITTGVAQGFEFAAYDNAAVVDMLAAGIMYSRERRRMAERFFR